ncbi:hypothetical protein GA0115246_115927 [Streptomyces sp. SolWspMP-sol7th]|nr:hypothetical protein GA0115246_115927 [Streptomyces sp. SolWspMP-sol7th]
MTVSASEWAASESIAEEPLTSPARSFAAAIPRLAPAATRTVKVLSPFSPLPPPGSGVVADRCTGSLLLIAAQYAQRYGYGPGGHAPPGPYRRIRARHRSRGTRISPSWITDMASRPSCV